MKTPRTAIAHTIADRSLKKGTSKALAREVAAYLLDEGRVLDLDSVLRDVQENWAASGYVEVIARSAHPLTASSRKDIERQTKKLYPAAKQILVTEVSDPAVLGGVRLEFAHQQLDVSVEAKLHRFKQLTSAGKDF